MKTEIEETEYTCPNCNNPVIDNFCSNCGQKKYKRIDRKYIFDEIQYILLHANKGLPYSVKHIIINPGKTAREFIEGKRVNHYKPLLLAFLLSGISAFVDYKIVGLNDVMKEIYSQLGEDSPFYNEVIFNDSMSFVTNFISFIVLLLIPVLAIFTKIVFKKWGHNYYEHVIMNSYIYSFSTLINILVFSPLLYVFKDDLGIFMTVMSLFFIVLPFAIIWFYKGFYSDKTLIKIILKVLLLSFLVFISYFVFIFAIYIFSMIIFGQEAVMQYMNIEIENP